jgi:N-acyl-D-amino-acid deacylase
MSSFPAWRLGLKDRSAIKVGMKADVVVFDANQVIDRSTMTQPGVEPVGVQYVLVNGGTVVAEGKVTGQRTGTILRHR